MSHNQAIYNDLKNTLTQLETKKGRITSDIQVLEAQLKAMEEELIATETTITMYKGGLSVISAITSNGKVILDSEAPVQAINPYQQQQMPQQQAQPQQRPVPTTANLQPQSPITQKGMETFSVRAPDYIQGMQQYDGPIPHDVE